MFDHYDLSEFVSCLPLRSHKTLSVVCHIGLHVDFFIHEIFSGHLGLHLLVRREFGKSPPFRQ